MSVSYIRPLPRVPLTADERFDAIERQLDAMSAELRDMLTIITRIAERLDKAEL